MLDMPAAGRAWQKRGPAGLKRPAGPARRSAAEMREEGGVSKASPIKIPQKQFRSANFGRKLGFFSAISFINKPNIKNNTAQTLAAFNNYNIFLLFESKQKERRQN